MGRRGACAALVLATAAMLAGCAPDGGGTATGLTGSGKLQLRPVLSSEPAGDGACSTGRTAPPAGGEATLCGWQGQDRTAYRLGPAAVDDSMLSAVSSSNDGNGPTVTITLTQAGAAALQTLTGELAAEQPPRNQIAIVTRGQVQSVSAVQEAIPSGALVISGFRSPTEATALVAELGAAAGGG